jgi:hypothetical protein
VRRLPGFALLSTAEAAAALHLGPKAARARLRAAGAEPVRTPGGGNRWRREDVERAMNAPVVTR